MILKIAEDIIEKKKPPRISYGKLEPFIQSIEEIVSKTNLAKDFPTRWLAIRLFDGDIDLESRLRKRGEVEVLRKTAKIREEIESMPSQRPEEIFAQKRFN